MKRIGQALMCGLVASIVLSGCSSLPKIEDVAGTATAAGVSTGLAVLNVHPVAAIAAGAASGAAVEVAIPEPESVDITQVTNEHQAQVAEKQITAHVIEDFIHWIIGGVVVLVIAAWLIPGPQTMFKRSSGNKRVRQERNRRK